MFTSASPFRTADLNRLRDSFEKLVHKVLHEDKPLGEHFETHLVNAYNAIIRYSATDYTKRKEKTRKFIIDTINECRIALRKCTDRLNTKIYFPSQLLSPITASEYSPPAPPGPNKKPSKLKTDSTEPEKTDPIHIHTTPPAPSPTPPNRENQQPIMGDFTYLANVGTIVKKTYSGDPSGLSTFIEAIELASALSQQNQIPTLIRFIGTKCDKIAKEAIEEINPPPTTVAQIVTALRNKIKVDNSKVVLGRLLALKCDKTSVQNFQEKGEELAEKLRLAYISDGIPAPVAKEMVIDKTIEMCRSSARTQLVKSVLASTKFDEPKEVLAKYVVEIASENKEVKEAQILKFSDNRYRGRGRGRGRGGYRGYYNNFNNNNTSYRGNNGYYSNNFNTNRGGRGRGRGRGGRNDRNDRNNGRQVYVIQENSEAPTQDRGATNDQNSILTFRQASHQ